MILPAIYQKAPGLGFDFFEEISKSVRNIERYPEGWPLYEENIRKYSTNRFPFSLYYVFEKDADKVIVVAVAHQKRRAGYWKRRI